MKLEIVDQDGSTIVLRNNEQVAPSVGDDINVQGKWYVITEKTFFYNEEETVVHLWSKLIEGA